MPGNTHDANTDNRRDASLMRGGTRSYLALLLFDLYGVSRWLLINRASPPPAAAAPYTLTGYMKACSRLCMWLPERLLRRRHFRQNFRQLQCAEPIPVSSRSSIASTSNNFFVDTAKRPKREKRPADQWLRGGSLGNFPPLTDCN